MFHSRDAATCGDGAIKQTLAIELLVQYHAMIEI